MPERAARMAGARAFSSSGVSEDVNRMFTTFHQKAIAIPLLMTDLQRVSSKWESLSSHVKTLITCQEDLADCLTILAGSVGLNAQRRVCQRRRLRVAFAPPGR